MTLEAVKQLKDEELAQVIECAQTELKDRAEKRRQDAMEQIRRIAASVRIQVNFAGSQRKASRNGKPALKAGERYPHPTDPTKFYVVGKGRPPEWFLTLREKAR
jgi:hypothetical protein